MSPKTIIYVCGAIWYFVLGVGAGSFIIYISTLLPPTEPPSLVYTLVLIEKIVFRLLGTIFILQGIGSVIFLTWLHRREPKEGF